jgi:hypothetical protein
MTKILPVFIVALVFGISSSYATRVSTCVVDNHCYGNRKCDDDKADNWVSAEERSCGSLTTEASVKSRYCSVERNSSGWFQRKYNFSKRGTDYLAECFRRYPKGRRNPQITCNITPSADNDGTFDVVNDTVELADDLPYTVVSSSTCLNPEPFTTCWNNNFGGPNATALSVITALFTCVGSYRRTCPAVVYSELMKFNNSCRSSVSSLVSKFTDGDTGVQTFCNFVSNSIAAPAQQWAPNGSDGFLMSAGSAQYSAVGIFVSVILAAACIVLVW